jgi:LEA14-like dessication related protein
MVQCRQAFTTYAGLVCTLLLTACVSLGQDINSLKQPQVSLIALALQDLNPLNPSALVRLKVDNPNDLDLNLSGADVALALNGQAVATGVSRSPVTLASFGTSEIDAEVHGNTLAMAQQLLLAQSNDNVNYTITGSLHILNWLGPLGRVPFTFDGAVDKKTLLRSGAAWRR